MRQEPSRLQANPPDLTAQTARQQGTEDLHALPEEEANSDAVAAQIDRIAEEISRFRGSLRRTMWKSLIFLFTPLVLITFLGALLLPAKDVPRIALGAPLLGVMGHIVVMRWAERRPSRKLIQLVQTLAQTNDIRAIGPLIDAFTLSEALAKDAKKIHAALIAALTPLLLRLQSEDAGSVSTAQCGLLCQHLMRLPGPEETMFTAHEARSPHIHAYRAAILQALAQIGGRSVLPTVQQLAWSSVWSVDSAQLSLQPEARACLAILERRLAEAQTANTLLRASERPDDAEQSLLRAAKGAQETQADQLLRPTNPDS